MKKTPFPEVLHSFNGFEHSQSWIDLRSLMQLRIENAYYQKGASRRGLAGFLGTEVAQYRIASQGLQLLSTQSMKNRPESETPVQQLISAAAASFRFYRFYYEIVFARAADSHGSALLGANSIAELNRLSLQLDQPETVCNSSSIHCTVFPEACSVSVEIELIVNGKLQTAPWGSLLASIADHPAHLAVKRPYAGHLAPVKIDLRDPNALRLPLLPGDRIARN